MELILVIKFDPKLKKKLKNSSAWWLIVFLCLTLSPILSVLLTNWARLNPSVLWGLIFGGVVVLFFSVVTLIILRIIMKNTGEIMTIIAFYLLAILVIEWNPGQTATVFGIPFLILYYEYTIKELFS